jgi:hypothetical protein
MASFERRILPASYCPLHKQFPVQAYSPETLVAPNVADQGTELNADDMVASMDAVDSENPAGGEGATQMLADNGVEETSEVAGMAGSL